jgi:nucleolar protein 56
MYLITKWFGTFLFDKNGIKEKILFPKNIKSISNRMLKINKEEILKEEKKISQNIKDLIVNEIRLKDLGEFKPDDPIFKKIDINPDEFGFSNNLLQKVTSIITEKKVEEELASEDIQIIQMINTLDDFIEISNLLSERIESWSIIPNSKQKMLPLNKTFLLINEEIKFLEEQIENEMKKIAPNLNHIVGSLIGARLISLSGGIKKLAMLPSSTIQILGAEKALFRYKKEGGKPPKHGIIFQHPYINRAHKNVRGKIARIFAAKIAIAAKADAFTKRDISNELKKNLNNRIKEIMNV